jgi:hypothetical protein
MEASGIFCSVLVTLLNPHPLDLTIIRKRDGNRRI